MSSLAPKIICVAPGGVRRQQEHPFLQGDALEGHGHGSMVANDAHQLIGFNQIAYSGFADPLLQNGCERGDVRARSA